jgi:hypothetical protein
MTPEIKVITTESTDAQEIFYGSITQQKLDYYLITKSEGPEPINLKNAYIKF